MLENTGRVALVTGAAQGIGRATTARLVRDGWAVLLVDLDELACRRAVTELSAGERVRPFVADVAEEPAVAAAVGAAVDGFGRLDAVVSNAGIMVRKPVTDLTLAEWSRVIGTNLTAAFLLAKHAAPHLRRQDGAMVTIGSTRAMQSEPDTESYTASKGGLVALTHALAVSLGPAVRVNCLSPGWIETSGSDLCTADHAQHPAGRVGRPEDVAGLVAWLLGPESGFVTGAHFVVDGGMTRKMIYA